MSSGDTVIPRTTPATLGSLIFHVASLFVLINAFQTLKEPSAFSSYIEKQYGQWYQFLTVLGLCSAMLTMSLAIVKDVIPSLRIVDHLKNACGIISVPAEGLIAVLYWGLRAYDPSLLVPPDPKFQIPLPLDLSLHAIPAMILWIDFLFLSPPFSKKSNPLLLSTVLTSAYGIWLEYCAKINRTFPYPFLGDLTPIQRALFYAAASLINIGLFYLANAIHLGVDRALGRDLPWAKAQAKGKRA